MKRLIFVLGSQRSGTNVLRQSLSLDPNIMGYNESASSELFDNWFLRSEPTIRNFILNKPHSVLIKPIKSVIKTPVARFLNEFSDYDLKVAWIYRDPVNVFYSRKVRWSYLKDSQKFVKEWNRINKSALEAKNRNLQIVQYEDLIADKKVFEKLCKELNVKGEYLFRPARNIAYEDLDDKIIDQIRKDTEETMAVLKKQKLKQSLVTERILGKK